MKKKSLLTIFTLLACLYFLPAAKADDCNLPAPIITPNITSICEGAPAIIEAGFAYDTYTWFYGNGTPIPIAGDTHNYWAYVEGSYYVVVTLNGCSATSASVFISAPGVPPINFPDTLFSCTGSATIDSGPAYDSVLWNTSHVGRYLTVTQSGWYGCAAGISALVCGVADSLYVQLNADPGPAAVATNLGSSTVCVGESVTISANITNGILWNTGETTPSIAVSDVGEYSFTALGDYGCTIESNLISIDVQELPIVEITNSGTNPFCEGSTIDLTSNFATNNEWSTGETSASITIASSGIYVLNYTDNFGCVGHASIDVHTQSCIPNTTVRVKDCGKTNFVRTSSILCDPVVDATGYEWEFSNINGVYATKITVAPTVPLHAVSPILNWGTSWQVRVRAIVNGVFGNFSNSCLIGIITDPTIGGVINTELRSGDCNKLTYTYNPTNNRIIANYVNGSLQYEFQFSIPGSGVVFATKIQSLNTLFLNTVTPALPFPAQYYVRVRANVGGVWGTFGNACLIGIVSLNRVADNSITEEFNYDEIGNVVSSKENVFNVSAMPNPFNQEISLLVNSSANETVNIKIYDITGQIVENVQVQSNQKINLGANYTNGIYIVNAIGQVTGTQVNSKVIKQ